MAITHFGKTEQVEVTPTIGTDAYQAGDVVGGLLTFTIPGARAGGMIRQIRLSDDDNEQAVLTLYLFASTPTTVADDAAFASAMTISDLQALLGIVSIVAGDYTTINSNDVVFKNGVDIDFPALSDDNLYGYLVCTATPTYAATTDLSIRIIAWVN